MPTNKPYEDIQRRLAQPRRTRHLDVRPAWFGEIPSEGLDPFWSHLQDITADENWAALAQLQLALMRQLEPGLRDWLTDDEFPYSNYQNYDADDRRQWWRQVVEQLTRLRDRDPDASWENPTFIGSLGRLHNAADMTLGLAGTWVWRQHPLAGVGLLAITKLFHQLSRFAIRHSMRQPHHRPIELPNFTRLVDDVAEAYETAAMGYAIAECSYDDEVWFDWLSGRLQNHDIEEEFGRTWFRPWCLDNGWERVLGAYQGSRPFRGTLGSRAKRRSEYAQIRRYLDEPIQYVYPEQPQELLVRRSPSILRDVGTPETLYRRILKLGPTQRAYATQIAIERIVPLLSTMAWQGAPGRPRVPGWVRFRPVSFEALANGVLQTVDAWRGLLENQVVENPNAVDALFYATDAAQGFPYEYQWNRLDDLVHNGLHPEAGLPDGVRNWLAIRIAGAAFRYAEMVLARWGNSYTFHGEVPVASEVTSAVWAAATAWGLHEAPPPGTDFERYRRVFLREWWRALENSFAFQTGLTDPEVI